MLKLIIAFVLVLSGVMSKTCIMFDHATGDMISPVVVEPMVRTYIGGSVRPASGTSVITMFFVKATT